MIVLIAGASHTGKTLLAQKLLKKYGYPYLSIDLLKMGLIRSGSTDLTALDDEQLQSYLWPIVREMIKTAVENKQDLVVEGAYIPFDWKKDFDSRYLSEIRYYCLVMSERYIRRHFAQIKAWANVIERRIDDSWCTMDFLLAENARCLAMCRQYGCPYLWIEEDYQVEIEL